MQAALLEAAEPFAMSTAIVPFAARKLPSLSFQSRQSQSEEALTYWRESLCPSWDLGSAIPPQTAIGVTTGRRLVSTTMSMAAFSIA